MNVTQSPAGTILLGRFAGISNAGTAVSLESQVVPSFVEWNLYHISVENDSGESVTVDLRITNGSEYWRVKPLQTVATGDSATWDGILLLSEGDQITAIVTGTALKGAFRLFISGEAFDRPGMRPGTPETVVTGGGTR